MISDKLFFTIKEAAEIVGVEPYVLRYWETEFAVLRPNRTKAGHRRYRKKDIELLFKIKDLLYNQGLTIRGVKKALKEKEEGKGVQLEEIKRELSEILEMLKR
jgi:DNA-binding transcriptional MerR regulator